MTMGCTCDESGRVDIGCPEHGAAENRRRLECAKRELDILMEMKRQGKRLTKTAREQAYIQAWGLEIKRFPEHVRAVLLDRR
jgi:hypothetical protein